MKNKPKIGSFIEILLWVLTTLIISLAEIKYPMLFMISLVLSVIPIVVITVKFNEYVALVSSLAIFGILLIKFPIAFAVIKVITFGIGGIIIGYSLKNKFSLNFNIIAGMTGLYIAFLISHMVTKGMLGINIIEELYINKIIDFLDVFKINTNNFALFFENIDTNEFTQKLTGFQPWWAFLFMIEMVILISFIGSSKISMLYIIIPGTIALLLLVASYFIILISGILLKKSKRDFVEIESFSKFNLPVGFGLAFIITQLFLWGSDLQYNISKTSMILINMLVIFVFGFMAQGMALFDYLVKKAGIKDSVRIVLYIITSPFIFSFTMLFVMVGILDYLMNFRKLETK